MRISVRSESRTGLEKESVYVSTPLDMTASSRYDRLRSAKWTFNKMKCTCQFERSRYLSVRAESRTGLG